MSSLSLFAKDGLEILIDTHTGESFCSQAAYCRMSGKSKSTISERMVGVREDEIKTAEIMTPGGIQAGQAIPIKTILEWLALDKPELITPIVNLVYERTDVMPNIPYIKNPKNNPRKNIEKKAQLNVAKILNGKTEVYCKSGKIDILTETEIIEVKKIRSWKAAIGQVLVYQLEYPDRRARIHLCGECSEEFKQMVVSFAGKLNIITTFEN